MTTLNPWDRHRSAGAGTVKSPTDYPTTESAWRDRLEWLLSCYTGDGYSAAAEEAWQLFSAYDPDGKLLARTRRVFGDFRFVTDRNAAALTGGRLVPQIPDETSGDEATKRSQAVLAEVRGAWARSNLDGLSGLMATQLAMYGWCGLEARREHAGRPHGTRVVYHEPATFTPVFDDATGTELVQVTITRRYRDAADVDQAGNVAESATTHVYQRVLTAESVEVTIDGQRQDAESGKHGAGVVPFVLLAWQPVTDLAHGLNAAHGIESAIAELDGIATQVSAAGKRFASPIPTVTGGRVANGGDQGQFGRWLFSTNESAKFGYMEPSMEGLTALLDAMDRIGGRVRDTYPEFALFSGGANLSAEALRLRGAAFESKVLGVRSRVLPAIGRILGIAAAMEQDRTYDPLNDRVDIAAGPVLPPDVTAEIKAVGDLKREGLITTVDAIRRAQALGYVPADADPVKYAEQVQDEQAARAANFFTSAGGA